MLPKADSGSFVLFSLLFVLTLTDPPRTGKFDLYICIYIYFFKKKNKEKNVGVAAAACVGLFMAIALVFPTDTRRLQLGAERPLS